MTSPIASYPLCWPDGYPRTERHNRRRHVFGVDARGSERHLLDEVNRLGASELIVSTNVRTKPNGFPYANDPAPSDPGVAAYFTMDGKQRVMACDVYETVAANVRALSLCIAAMRALERHGSSEILERAFRGFAALPATASPASWTAVLGIAPNASEEEIDSAYRKAALLAHPDKGGSTERMAEVNAAREAALASRIAS